MERHNYIKTSLEKLNLLTYVQEKVSQGEYNIFAENTLCKKTFNYQKNICLKDLTFFKLRIEMKNYFKKNLFDLCNYIVAL